MGCLTRVTRVQCRCAQEEPLSPKVSLMSTLRVCDPHFHMWDTNASPNPNLGDLGASLPVYLWRDYEAETAGSSVTVASCVHVEATVGQQDGQPVLDPVAETKFVVEQLRQTGVSANIVAFVQLARGDAEAVLQQHVEAAQGRLVGVRMILNYDDKDPSLCWPQVGRGDFLTGGVPGFEQGYALLGKYGLSFDLQVNWFQLSEAAAFVSRFPGVPVIVNHLGCLKLGAGEEEDARRISVWREGMRALAPLSHVVVKASQLQYIHARWQQPQSPEHALLKSLVREVIELFGADRVMFASNFPVDKVAGPGTALPALYHDLHALVSDLPEAQQAALLHDTAARVYRLHA